MTPYKRRKEINKIRASMSLKTTRPWWCTFHAETADDSFSTVNKNCFAWCNHHTLSYLRVWLNPPKTDYQYKIIHFVMNDSHLSRVFHSSDPDDWGVEGVRINTNLSWSEILCALSIVRDVVDTTGDSYNLSKDVYSAFPNINVMLPYMISALYTTYYGSDEYITIRKKRYTTGHCAMPIGVKFSPVDFLCSYKKDGHKGVQEGWEKSPIKYSKSLYLKQVVNEVMKTGVFI